MCSVQLYIPHVHVHNITALILFKMCTATPPPQVSDQVGMIHNILDNGEAMVKFGRSSERKLQLRQLTKVCIHVVVKSA